MTYTRDNIIRKLYSMKNGTSLNEYNFYINFVSSLLNEDIPKIQSSINAIEDEIIVVTYKNQREEFTQREEASSVYLNRLMRATNQEDISAYKTIYYLIVNGYSIINK